MPSGTGARRLLLLGGIGLLALFIAGLVTGAIGTAILREKMRTPSSPNPMYTFHPSLSSLQANGPSTSSIWPA